jgi:hypothetical protein
MKCFIASAFGYADVDEIYDTSILPILRELRIKPLRIDRVEHNEDIDDMIFQLIDTADFCIADLTYARPSVYYEAGYIYGSGKPVIYISRRDHFRAKDSDPLGNLRVHFDLQMKNIIGWSKPNKTFNDRLRSRILHIIKPILHKKKSVKEESVQARKFASLSLSSQHAALLAKGRNLLFSRGFKKGRFPERRPIDREPHHAHLERFKEKTFQQIHLVNLPSVTKTSMSGFLPYLFAFITKEEESQIKKKRTLILISSIRPVRKSTLAMNLSSYSPISDFIYIKQETDRSDTPHDYIIAAIGGVKSIEDYASRLRSLCKQVGFD